MTSAAVDFGVGRILSILESEALLLTGIHGEVEKTRKGLMIMNSFLEDTTKHGGTTTQVFQTFVSNTRDLANQIEDIIDEFTYLINGYHSLSMLQRAFRLPMYIWTKRSIASKLETVNATIQALSDTMKRYSSSNTALPVVGGDDRTKRVRNIGESSLFIGDDSLVGIDAAKGKLIGWLLNSELQRTVVSVVGMGGSGKTTLAANIFKSQMVQTHFDSSAWVTISQSYVIEDVFRSMIKEFYKEAETQVPGELYSMSYRELVEKLVNHLHSKRYIVVLDDVWSTSLWTEIRVALPDGICGSRVMITTRDETVASFSFGIGSQTHKIEPLNEEEAWKLFCNKAFSGNLECCRTQNIEQIARNLVERCQGLPLAIVALGSMMSTKKLKTEWKKVYDTLNWELNNHPELKVVQSILLLSFKDLSYPLKHCFLYCCLFPENYRIRRKRLVRMWMAQGFVERIKGAKPEEVGDSYIMELVYRNMLQAVLTNHLGRPKALKMHDVIREIALPISKAEMFCDVCDDEAEAIENVKTRHLCIRGHMTSGRKGMNLSSLLVFSATNPEIALPPRMKLLRALDLQDCTVNKLPDSLVKLFNLKYLNLMRTQVKELPKAFHKLLNLETLNTKHSKIAELPLGVSKLQKLRHLITFRHNDGHDSDWNYVLGTGVPSDIWKLKNLQVMDCINAKTELIKKLGNMTQLTRISLAKVRKDHGNDLCNSLNRITGLRFLSLTSIDEEETLKIDTLSSTTNIEKLFLAGKLEKLPSWFTTLHSLSYLGLRWSGLDEDAIRCIKGLPNLMPRLGEIIICDGSMPDLQKLYVIACRGMKSVPNGIESLVKLQELHLIHVSDQLVDSICGEKSIDRSKVEHIPTIKHYFRTGNGSYYESLS
ncbi:PREDICTED: disease resistance protein RPM1 isoform X2 [Tarenaya hassleriana]|uniref:disease resistance protein RPM1 isoform X2 n=1 Tax=Tarenaya hassleriana TaxID=28532 RepID=UPI00053C6A85|nr:PREDICTED: disease resistance protein RPM1 isoform X2 [Tarenaya hassleriana]